MGGSVVAVADDAGLPFRAVSFNLVVSRHPVVTRWDEIARVLRPGGTYLSQQVGPGSVRELTDFMMGPQPVSQTRSPRRAAAAAETAGLVVTDLKEEALRMEFHDGACRDSARDRNGVYRARPPAKRAVSLLGALQPR